MRCFIARVSVVITAVTGLAVLLVLPGSSDQSSFRPVAHKLTSTLRFIGSDGRVLGQTTGTQSESGDYVCNASVLNPHFSDPARGNTVLFKTRITCQGPTPVEVRITGTLGSVDAAAPPSPAPGEGFVARANSGQTQQVANDGKTPTTYYTPMLSGPTVKGSGWYVGTISGEILAPVPGTLGKGHSNVVYIVTP
jgi:hypothetical protein